MAVLLTFQCPNCGSSGAALKLQRGPRHSSIGSSTSFGRAIATAVAPQHLAGKATFPILPRTTR
jgi:hypothetical protein